MNLITLIVFISLINTGQHSLTRELNNVAGEKPFQPGIK